MKIQVIVFWVMTPCSDVVGCQHFRRTCWLHLQSEMHIAGKGGIDMGIQYKKG